MALKKHAHMNSPSFLRFTFGLHQVEKLERTKKYAEFVRQQHKNNIVAKEKKMDSGELADYGYEVGNYQHHFSTTIDDNIRREQYDRRQRVHKLYLRSNYIMPVENLE